MNKLLKDAGLIQKFTGPMAGVFSIGDLSRLFGERDTVLLHRRIRTLEEGGIITRFVRGFYTTKGFSRESLAARIIERSYVSLGTILAKELMIGSVPAATCYSVRVGKHRTFKGPGLTLEYVGITEHLYFGFRTEQGLRFATPEKALLDTLYFHLRGRSYSFNIYQDIDISRIDRTVINGWLKKYRNPRFVSFVKGYLNDRS
jgi:hypothetical protein